jgi:hypothetical protein
MVFIKGFDYQKEKRPETGNSLKLSPLRGEQGERSQSLRSVQKDQGPEVKGG